MLKKIMILLSAGLMISMIGCATRHNVKLEPVEVKPIHITIDVNIRVDRALDDFFGDIDEVAEKIDTKTPDNTPSETTDSL